MWFVMIRSVTVTLVIWTSFLTFLPFTFSSFLKPPPLPGWLGSALSPEHSSKHHSVKSDPTPFGFKGILLLCDSSPSFVSPWLTTTVKFTLVRLHVLLRYIFHTSYDCCLCRIAASYNLTQKHADCVIIGSSTCTRSFYFHRSPLSLNFEHCWHCVKYSKVSRLLSITTKFVLKERLFFCPNTQIIIVLLLWSGQIQVSSPPSILLLFHCTKLKQCFESRMMSSCFGKLSVPSSSIVVSINLLHMCCFIDWGVSVSWSWMRAQHD